MKRKTLKSCLKYGFIAGLIFLGFVLWPVRQFFSADFLTSRHLVLLTNEAELRPCGGFVTAYGEVQVWPWHLELHNAYKLSDKHFGASEFPFQDIAPKKQFWDLGVSPNIQRCSDDFLRAYNQVKTEAIPEKVILISIRAVELLSEALGPFQFSDQEISAENLFVFLTRSAAQIDRHDETALKHRKSFLAPLGETFVRNAIRRFWRWPRVSKWWSAMVQSGEVFLSDFSAEIVLDSNDFALLEWNLGGGKTSRALKKTFAIQAREIRPNQWNIQAKISAENLAGHDEPIGQYWKGGFELFFPKYFDQEKIWIETVLAPGGSFSETYSFDYEGQLSELSVFRSRGQELLVDAKVSVFPQQYITSEQLQTRENYGQWLGPITETRKTFQWDASTDTTAPFVTFHKKISAEIFPAGVDSAVKKSDFIAEIHFNEKVRLTNDFSATLLDRNYAVPDIRADLFAENWILTSNDTALLIGFSQLERQPFERYTLELAGVEDLYGNAITAERRTVVER